jgi:hypothetical protein
MKVTSGMPSAQCHFLNVFSYWIIGKYSSGFSGEFQNIAIIQAALSQRLAQQRGGGDYLPSSKSQVLISHFITIVSIVDFFLSDCFA